MKIDKERLELLTTALPNEDSWVEFYVGKSKGIFWVVTDEDVIRYNKYDPNDDDSLKDSDNLPYDEFLEDVSRNDDLTAEYEDLKFEEWEKLANYVGVSNLVCVSTKIPGTIAKRFKYFSDGTVSRQLRQLIFDFVKKEIEKNSESIMFKSDF